MPGDLKSHILKSSADHIVGDNIDTWNRLTTKHYTELIFNMQNMPPQFLVFLKQKPPNWRLPYLHLMTFIIRFADEIPKILC